MEIQTSNKSGDFEKPRIEEGVYTAELIEVKDISDGQYGPRVALVYKLVEGKIDGTELAHVCQKPKQATPENKLGKALMAHGLVLEDGKIDTTNLPNKLVKVWVEDYDAEDKVKASTIVKVKPLIEKVE